ncbi:hyccin-like isoform X2 [Amphibalanus amphitrite]|uniref:hyccin-like isoform X2 n=1 Tax=Amphibalanus amphitrite TaxID=1232801 RepID=UPI001C8FDD4B|nr:hyccin-like isoform X2 [Amphibalanus amphitrite]XP_043200802.1 hyccin-like isoform X2 [Amphibalanus amphitrite]XP_043200812.1 hyccin-like isoform X2 [Amphibalanus amphitrite]
MADSPIHEWIQEWQSIKPLDVKSYAANLMADHETTAALLRVFEDPNLHHLLDDVCGQLLTFYRSREPNLVHFSLQCLPPLMHAYLNAVATRNQKTSKPTETLLLGMYNLEVVDERGQPRVVSFRMPTLIKQSVYHMPLHMAPSSLTEHSLSRLELGDAFSVEWGPLPQAQRIRASNRQQVLSALMTVYNRYLSQMSEPALQAACRAIIRICGQGFTMTAPPLDPRLTVSSDLQLEFLHAIYFIMYETVTAAATQALEAVTFRGQYDVSAKVTVAANAMRNSLNISPAGLTDSQLNLTELPSVTSLPAAVNKFIITNASFRTKKLPDDIDPPPEDTTDSSGPASVAHTPSPAATATSKLRKGIRSIKRRIRRSRGRHDHASDQDPGVDLDPNRDPALLEGSSSSGEDHPEARGSVSTDSFHWILTREEAEQRGTWQTELGDWRRLGVFKGGWWDDPWTGRSASEPSSSGVPYRNSARPSVHFSDSTRGGASSSWRTASSTWLSEESPDEPPDADITANPASDASVRPSAPPAPDEYVVGDLEPPSPDGGGCSAAEASPSGSGDGRTCSAGEQPSPAALSPTMVALELPNSPRSSQTTSLYSASDGEASSDDTDKFHTSSP